MGASKFEFQIEDAGGDASKARSLATLNLPSAERRQLHQIRIWHRFERLAGFAPGCKPARNHKCAESLLPQ